MISALLPSEFCPASCISIKHVCVSEKPDEQKMSMLSEGQQFLHSECQGKKENMSDYKHCARKVMNICTQKQCLWKAEASENWRKQLQQANNCSRCVETVSWERMWLEQKEVLDKHMGRKCSRVRGVLRPGKWAEQEGSLRGGNLRGKVLEWAWERGQWERMSSFRGVIWNK